MLSEDFKDALNELSALAGDVPPHVWQRLRRIKKRFQGLEERISGLENATINTPVPLGAAHGRVAH